MEVLLILNQLKHIKNGRTKQNLEELLSNQQTKKEVEMAVWKVFGGIGGF